jgi:hypothetical protein
MRPLVCMRSWPTQDLCISSTAFVQRLTSVVRSRPKRATSTPQSRVAVWLDLADLGRLGEVERDHEVVVLARELAEHAHAVDVRVGAVLVGDVVDELLADELEFCR